MSPNSRAPKRRAVLGVALAAALVAAGCGSGSKSSSDTTAAPTTTGPSTSTTAAAGTTTAAPTTTTTAATATVSPAQALGVVTGFAQAIGTKDYSAAYQAWAQGGAASGSSEADFAAGYAATDQYDLHVTAVHPTETGVDVDVVVLAVATDSGGTQLLQMFQGTYVVAPTDAGARLATGQLAAIDALPTDLADAIGSPQGLIDGYYAYIDAGNHGAAFTLWSGSGTSSGTTPADFIAGYAATRSDTVTMGQFDESPGAGSLYAEVPTVVQATTTSGAAQLFCGTYTLRKSNLPPFDGLGWAIETADLQAVTDTSTDPGTLLSNGCAG